MLAKKLYNATVHYKFKTLETTMAEDMTAAFVKLADMFAPEELNSELEQHIFDGRIGKMIHHPLVIEIMYDPASNKTLNQRFSYKKEMLDKAIKEENWEQFIFLHERPYRIDALEQVIWQEAEGNPDNWKLIHSVWTDSENIYENFDRWNDIWNADIVGRFENVMCDEERYILADLPEQITIYRGFTHVDAEQGMSWTIDRNKAVWFAKRFSQDKNPMIATGLIEKRKVLAYSMARSESEIIAFPQDVCNVIIEKIGE